MGFSGMLWFDNRKGKTIEEKARGAIEWHKKRYGKPPQICLLNAGQFAELEVTEIDGVSLRAYKACLPNHFIAGFDNPVPERKFEGDHPQDCFADE